MTWTTLVALLDTIPGVDRRIAEVMLAEMGLDMSQFPTADHLTSWAGLAPGNYQSGGKRYSGRTTNGNGPLATIMVQAGWSAVRTEDTFLRARFHRSAARRGRKRAIVAMAHSMLVSTWHMLTYQRPHQELSGGYFNQRKKETKVSYLVRRLEKLTGGSGSIELQPAASAAQAVTFEAAIRKKHVGGQGPGRPAQAPSGGLPSQPSASFLHSTRGASMRLFVPIRPSNCRKRHHLGLDRDI